MVVVVVVVVVYLPCRRRVVVEGVILVVGGGGSKERSRAFVQQRYSSRSWQVTSKQAGKSRGYFSRAA